MGFNVSVKLHRLAIIRVLYAPVGTMVMLYMPLHSADTHCADVSIRYDTAWTHHEPLRQRYGKSYLPTLLWVQD
jgi:hypothetical protein